MSPWFERNEHGRLEELRNGDEPTDAIELFSLEEIRERLTSPDVIEAAARAGWGMNPPWSEVHREQRRGLCSAVRTKLDAALAAAFSEGRK